jgi:endonuclease/exonuclease/phosphatase family metal-dependent hydrolase
MEPNFQIATAGLCDERGSAAIDHLAVTNDLKVEAISVLSSMAEGRKLSDHFGFVADVRRSELMI